MLLGDPPPDVDISGITGLPNAVAEANEVWIESMRPLRGEEVLARFRSVAARRLEALDAMTQADFDAPSWTPAGPDETYGRFMRIRHYDCFLHEADIREALGRPGPRRRRPGRGRPVEPASGLGYIVGKKARMPSGASVRIHVTGVGGRHLPRRGR